MNPLGTCTYLVQRKLFGFWFYHRVSDIRPVHVPGTVLVRFTYFKEAEEYIMSKMGTRLFAKTLFDTPYIPDSNVPLIVAEYQEL